MNITLKPGEMLDESTGEIKSAEQIVAEIAATHNSAESYISTTELLDRKKEVLGQLIELDDECAVTDWQLCTTTPAHDGEYEVIHPITGAIFRAEYDTLFEVWSCDYQYPTWRGLREQAS